MLPKKVIQKTINDLRDMGWNQHEISQALIALGEDSESVNVVMPAHFKKEAAHHAKCYCLYVKGLKTDSPQFKKTFKKAYRQYLIDAWSNSRGVEMGSDVKKSNPAGIEVNVFDRLESQGGVKVVPDNTKQAIRKRAPAGIMFMGRDGWLQKCMLEIYTDMTTKRGIDAESAKHLLKDIITQYSAAITSLGNTFLFAFGSYNTKRKFSGVEIYDQNEATGNLEKKIPVTNLMPLEFNKSNQINGNELLNVTYRQMTRQVYLYLFSTIVAGIGAIRSKELSSIENGVKTICNNLWNAEKNNPSSKYRGKVDIPLGFLLKRKTREQVLQQFMDYYAPKITERTASGNSIREQYLSTIMAVINDFGKNPYPPVSPSSTKTAKRVRRKP